MGFSFLLMENKIQFMDLNCLKSWSITIRTVESQVRQGCKRVTINYTIRLNLTF